MSALIKRQHEFAVQAAKLILEAAKAGYLVTLGHAYRCQDCKTGKKNSLHKSRLAIDLNLFDQNCNYLTDGTGHTELHVSWRLNGGRPALVMDQNHYSFDPPK